MQLARVIETSALVTATRSRTAKVAALAQTLQEAASSGEVAVVTDYLAGRLPQRTVGVSWRGLRALPAPADTPGLTVAQVDAALSALASIAGSGSGATRSAAVTNLFSRATEVEQRWLVGLITGELRQGAGDGVILKAISEAAQVPESDVRRAVMLAGFAGPVAAAALGAGGGDAAARALAEIQLEVGRPLRPMLAASAPDIPGVVDGQTVVGVETKVDGIRLQVHLRDGEVRLFTRTLEEVTDRMPEVVEAVAELPTRRAVLDGEVIALTREGRPEPFQVTGARTASTADPAALREQVPLTTFLFDLLHLDGRDLVDEPAADRWAALAELAPHLLVSRVVTDDPVEAQTFFRDQVSAGHEGVVVKALSAPYAAGRRGAGWVKVKPRHTLDLVVLAVEWGSGRRHGWLSNIHLGARDPQTGELVMLGKTFKGMTDEMLEWQTARFLELETHREGHVVLVRPEQVVEIAYDGVQRSPRYPGGVALRFARVLRYRDDKPVSEIDPVPVL
ncbi:ATP-dependent DNA ligase [Ornithinimicrobium cryptoxanthini]|uniref:DNA ligase (ATP) n=1 Tax=Ornithinimicrobium cryptoxanthini TaxID=2934161 RepID=A0ABY4YIF7_9MICO|nr:ATP-dependent DNA ligase [Ornithinimicrobium cryptoxanthini]USQ76412.1 ATP-dependent DNA ligase [Ornithinimicrobium cryptoxanthini]